MFNFILLNEIFRRVKMDNLFKEGDRVCLKSSPYKPVLTIEEVFSDKTYKCFWVDKTQPRFKDRREIYKEVLLQYYVSPAGVTILQHKHKY